MTTFCKSSLKLFVVLFAFILFAFSDLSAAIQRNFCRDCQIVTEVDAVRCPQCDAPLNLCLDCGHENPVNVDFCKECHAPLAEMRVLSSIDPETRKELKLGKSERAELEKELVKLNYLLEKNPENLEKLLFRKGKILHRMEFFSREAMVWKEYLRLFPDTSKKSFIRIYLSEALRKWGYLFYSQKKIASATELIAESTRVNEMNKEAWEWLGRLSMETKDLETAKEAYLKALQIEPGNKTSIHFLRKLGVKIPEELKKGSN
jgi:tetratricopeptide (TPR) repeat protein